MCKTWHLTRACPAPQLFRTVRNHHRFGSAGSAGSGAELAELAAGVPNGGGLEDGLAPSSPSANGMADQTRHRPATKGVLGV